jgi:hypothetical protein
MKNGAIKDTVALRGLQWAWSVGLLMLLAACAGVRAPEPAKPSTQESVAPPEPVVPAPAPAPVQEPAPVAIAAPPPAPVVVAAPRSQAATLAQYRKDAADHLYKKYPDRIYLGTLPPMLQAVAVLEVDIDPQGAVSSIRWVRAPRHIVNVMGEIEKMVSASAPFPVPVRLGPVTYTETWLWHQSGHFQLHTLSEGQK